MKHRLLIADPDPRMRRIIRQVVAGLAGAVHEASTVTEAVVVGLAECPDWVVMDLRMSLESGFRAWLEIQAARPGTRVIVVSQDDDAGLRAKALRAGACAFVLKENLVDLRDILMGMPKPGRGAEDNPRAAGAPASTEAEPPHPHGNPVD